MLVGMYIGEIKHLQGETALLKMTRGKCFAQFDNVNLSKKGIVDELTPLEDRLGYNWHQFKLEDFAGKDLTNNDS